MDCSLLLITPPFTQLNTPYPATAYLKGFLNTKGISSFQMDLGIEVILQVFSKQGLMSLFKYAEVEGKIESDNANRILVNREKYERYIDSTILFLQGRQPSLAKRIVSEHFLPQASRFDPSNDLTWAFGSMGVQDKAKYLATLFLEDISDFIVECVDPHFGFSRYAERLGRSANSFDDLQTYLDNDPSYIDMVTLPILQQRIEEVSPKLICFSVPFPGNLYSAFRCAKFIKANYPEIKTAMGGGFPNTELRSVQDTRVFSYFDYITLDDGELPIEILASNVLDPSPSNPNYNLYKRTFLLQNNEVVYNDFSLRKDYSQAEVGTPDYADLLLDKYISVIEMANPMHSLWSDGRWNKLTMAHGCYWGKCTFCDISLDYIQKYEPMTAKLLVDRMEAMIAQTRETGFHFVDEAAPPALMRELAIEIIRRGLVVSWWTNIRFEKSFTRDLCRLLQASGCIAVSGGLEVASDRLLALIEKGVTVAQVACVTSHFTDAGIMVHAYLMYGYPSQTDQETIDSLEMVRQMFDLQILESGFWHQFALTAHSPVGMSPEKYGVIPIHNDITFANNDVQFADITGIDHDRYSFGLKKSLLNYMHQLCLDFPLSEWFDFDIPRTSIAPNYISSCLEGEEFFEVKPTSKIIWIGGEMVIYPSDINREGRSQTEIQVSGMDLDDIFLDDEVAYWLYNMIIKLNIFNPANEVITYAEVKASYEEEFEDFSLFWFSDEMHMIQEAGLLIV